MLGSFSSSSNGTARVCGEGVGKRRASVAGRDESDGVREPRSETTNDDDGPRRGSSRGNRARNAPANELVTSNRPFLASPSKTPMTRLLSVSSSSTRRKWSTTERSTRGWTTTSSYSPFFTTWPSMIAVLRAILGPNFDVLGRDRAVTRSRRVLWPRGLSVSSSF